MGIVTGTELRSRLLSGAEQLAKVVTVTLGPGGRTVLLDRFAGLLATKDGVTIAREVQLADSLEAVGARITAEACLRVNREVGDGTTSTACMALVLLREGHRLVVAGLEPNEVLEGMRLGSELALQWIGKLCSPVHRHASLTQIALIASNGDEEVAEVLSKAAMAVGQEGVILVDEGVRVGVHLSLREGMEIETCLPYRSGLEDATETLEGPLVAILNRHLRTVSDIQDVVETATQYPPFALLIMALSVSGDALTTLAANKKHLKGQLELAVLETPGLSKWKSDELRDVAAAAGATFVDPVAGHDHTKWNPDWYGSFRQVKIGLEKTSLVTYPDHQEHRDRRVHELSLESDACGSDYDIDQYDKRIARLSGALATVEVTSATQAALRERRGRIEDALAALRAALDGGVVPGGGVAYLEGVLICEETANHTESVGVSAGLRAVAKALIAPFLALAHNAGQDAPALLYRVQQERDLCAWAGWDTSTIRDLSQAPLIADPFPVVQEVIRSAVSVASTLLSVEVGISNKKR
jgi:chaperonin GroEL